MKNPGSRVKGLIGSAVVALSLMNWAAQGQTSNKQMLEELIRGVGVSVEDLSLPSMPTSSQDIRVRWQGDASALPTGSPTERQPSSPNSLSVLSRQTGSESLPRHRAPMLSSDQVLVLAVDTQKQLKGWTLIPDPRVLRAEFPDSGGQLRGQIIYRSSAEFVVALPDDPAIAELHFYHPRWTGKAFILDLIEAISLPK
jgi:hypothetical protein